MDIFWEGVEAIYTKLCGRDKKISANGKMETL